MNETFKGFWGFWRGVFSENNGTPSFSRIFSGLVVSFACGWVTAIVKHNFALPDFAGLAMFIGTLYAINQAGSAIRSKQSPMPPEADAPETGQAAGMGK